jgi:chromosome segregation ATPase
VSDSFELLEEKVRKTADLVGRLRKENREMQEELGLAAGRLREAEKRLEAADRGRGAVEEEARRIEALSREIAELRGERDEIRNRIARLLEVLEGL